MEHTADISATGEIDVTSSNVAVRAAVEPSRLMDFYELTKPRMNFLVLITTMVGYFVATGGAPIHLAQLLNTLLGTAMCAACAAVLNQLVERDHDARMKRTRNRPLPAGRVAPREALAFGVILGVLGVAHLAVLVNVLTALLGAVTVAWYLGVYTPTKRITSLNTVLGAVPGALPPVMGFAAAGNTVSLAALAVFGILFLWQMPHFLAIAIMYRDDYRAGGFKMLPCVEPDEDRLRFTGLMMVLYAIALVPVSVLPSMLGVTGPAYFTAAVLLGLGFLSFAVSCATSGGARPDAKKLFFASIIYLPLLLAAMMVDRI
jgi:heme o synthase